MATSSSSSQRGGASRELQGPRPAPLKVQKDSHKISKPPVQVRQPVIIYTVSPKVVHANPSEFMSVVQRLTGARSAVSPPPIVQATPTPTLPFPIFAQPSSSSTLPPAPQPQFPFQLQAGPHEGALQLSPAARLAAIEQARSAGGDTAGGLPPLPSILSPVPGSLPAIPASFFSPPAGGPGGGINLFGEMISPAFLGHYNPFVGGSITTANTTGAGATPMLQLPAAPSPSPSGADAYYWDLFNSINQQQQHHPNPNPGL